MKKFLFLSVIIFAFIIIPKCFAVTTLLNMGITASSFTAEDGIPTDAKLEMLFDVHIGWSVFQKLYK